MTQLIISKNDAFEYSRHGSSILCPRLEDTSQPDFSSTPGVPLDSLPNPFLSSRNLFHMEDMLGEIVYAAKEPGTDLPDRGIHPGRLAAIAANGEGHVLVDLPCADPTAHPHAEICHQYIDQELVRHAGVLQDGLSGSVIFKGEDKIHRPIEFLAATSRGLTLIPWPGEAGNELFAWMWPPEPVDLIDGKRVFRDRTVDSADRVSRLHYARRRTRPNRSPYFNGPNPDEPDWNWISKRMQRGAIQGFLLPQRWSYRDPGGKTVEVPAVHHGPPNQDAELINSWLAARPAGG